MATLHLMVGLPCSGKTTLAQKLEHELPALRSALDEWHIRLFGQDAEEPEHDYVFLRHLLPGFWRILTIKTFLMKYYAHSITSLEVVAFLKQLQRLIPGLLLVIWGGSPTHRSRVIKDYLASGATQRLHLERFPGYAPELNPTEWVWSYLKLADLANIAYDHLVELDAHLSKAQKRLQCKPNLIQAFIQNAGYEV